MYRSSLIIIALMSTLQSGTFKEEQLRYERVRNAQADKGETIQALLDANKIGEASFDLYLRAFKEEGELELWAKRKNSEQYQLMRSYVICARSGGIGPKRKQGDKQVPEGFYHIDRFNPVSNFHLSLGVNYPNRSDLQRSDKTSPGGDIFIHGDCVTIGCLPITDDKIEELYLLCVEAKDRGTGNIPVTFFPQRMDAEGYASLLGREDSPADTRELWSALKSAYDLFESERKLPNVRFEADGSHTISP